MRTKNCKVAIILGATQMQLEDAFNKWCADRELPDCPIDNVTIHEVLFSEGTDRDRQCSTYAYHVFYTYLTKQAATPIAGERATLSDAEESLNKSGNINFLG